MNRNESCWTLIFIWVKNKEKQQQKTKCDHISITLIANVKYHWFWSHLNFYICYICSIIVCIKLTWYGTNTIEKIQQLLIKCIEKKMCFSRNGQCFYCCRRNNENDNTKYISSDNEIIVIGKKSTINK